MLKLGRDFVLLIDGGAGYARVEAQRSTSVSITSDVVDSTTKGEDWREILRNAGINAAQINVSGVSVDAPALQLITAKRCNDSISNAALTIALVSFGRDV